MFCTKCGKELNDDWKSCPHCGQEVKHKSDEKKMELWVQEAGGALQDPNVRRATARRIVKLLALVMIICFFCPMYMVSCGSREIDSVSGFNLTVGFSMGSSKIDGQFVWGMLLLLPLFVFLKRECGWIESKLNAKAAVEIMKYIDAVCFGMAAVFETYLVKLYNDGLERSMINITRLMPAKIMVFAAVLGIVCAIYEASFSETTNKNGELLSPRQKILVSIGKGMGIVIISAIVLILALHLLASNMDL